MVSHQPMAEANGDPDGDGRPTPKSTLRVQLLITPTRCRDGKNDNVDQYPTDPNDGEYSDSDGDGIPDVYDPDFQESMGA